MLKNLPFIIFLLFSGFVYSQTTITTNHSNNNGNGSVTFNVYNSNSYDIVVTDIQCHLGTSQSNYCQLLVNPTPVNDNAPPWSFGIIGNGQNGWVLKGAATIPSNTNNGIVTAISELETIIPAGATYGFGFSATTLQYQTLPVGTPYSFTEGGVSLLTGDGISWGGIAYPSTPANYPRGLIGGITFVPAFSCVSPPSAGTVSSTRNCTSEPVRMWVPYAGTNATYQWQSSATGSNYTSISGASSRAYNTSVSSDTYFRCYVTCGGASDTTAGFLLSVPKSGHITPILCHGEVLNINGNTYNATGTYTQVLTGTNGCDSTLTIDLTIEDEKTGHITPVICSNEVLNIAGTIYNTSGSYTQVLTAANGCDSTLTIDLTVLDAKTKLINSTICYGEELDINGTIYKTTGTYTQVLTASNGCDSTLTIDVTVLDEKKKLITSVICYGEDLDINGTIYSSTGTYTQVLTGANGCDSTLTIDLTVLDEKKKLITSVICYGEDLDINGTIYSSTGTYTQVLTGANGCDSTLTINLTVLDEKKKLITSVICHGEDLDINGTIYNATGTYTQLLTGTNGCDSTLTIDLTVYAQQDVAVTVSGATLTAAVSGATYQWLDAENNYALIQGATNQSYTATASGQYAVIITENSCSDTSEVQTITITDIQKFHNNDLSVTVAPNPTSGSVTIGLTGAELKTALSEGIHLTILNSLNEPVYTTIVYSEQYTIDMENYKSGMYFLQLKTRNNTTSQKIVKN